jgi:hypothetical protein
LDVVIVTLLRETLHNTLESVKAVIPNPNVILVTGKGVIGELRNKGLLQCSSSLACFVDDDIILNSSWYAKCMEALQAHPELIAVCGRTAECYTSGCMICRTREFKSIGGFPKLDAQVKSKLGPKMLTLEDAVCEHQIRRGFEPIRHNLHFLCHGFQTENRAGWWFDPLYTIRVVFGYFRRGYPDYAVGYSLWLVKTFFSVPFILEDRRERKKREG